jgi:hypothetical protein
MIVSELIKSLQKFPLDTCVMVTDEEGNHFEDLFSVEGMMFDVENSEVVTLDKKKLKADPTSFSKVVVLWP